MERRTSNDSSSSNDSSKFRSKAENETYLAKVKIQHLYTEKNSSKKSDDAGSSSERSNKSIRDQIKRLGRKIMKLNEIPRAQSVDKVARQLQERAQWFEQQKNTSANTINPYIK